MKTIELANFAANAALDKKAKRLMLIDLKNASDLCDYQLLCSGQNNQQTKAIAHSITESLEKADIKVGIIEGQQLGDWILMDYGSLLIHVFNDAVRDYYAIERLWPEAEFVELSPSQP